MLIFLNVEGHILDSQAEARKSYLIFSVLSILQQISTLGEVVESIGMCCSYKDMIARVMTSLIFLESFRGWDDFSQVSGRRTSNDGPDN